MPEVAAAEPADTTVGESTDEVGNDRNTHQAESMVANTTIAELQQELKKVRTEMGAGAAAQEEQGEGGGCRRRRRAAAAASSGPKSKAVAMARRTARRTARRRRHEGA